MVKEDDGYIYTLVSIYLEDEDGKVTKLKSKDIKQIDENGKVNIIDNMIDVDPEDIPCIWLQGYKKVGEEIEKVATNSEEIDYIGIAIDTGAEDYIRDGYIKIFNEDMEDAKKLI